MVSHRDLFKFLFGFVGLISLALSILVVIGFYQVEIVGKKSFSASATSPDSSVEERT